jgi:chorismate-pyruvate lyase
MVARTSARSRLGKRCKRQYYGFFTTTLDTSMSKSSPISMQAYFKSRGYAPGGIVTNSKNETLHMERLPAFLRTLLVADGTVTKSLEAYFWEQIEVENLGQAPFTLQEDIAALDLRAGQVVLERRVRLRGLASARNYAHAHSLINLEALPEHLRVDLQQGRIGIGELLRERGVETYREILDVGYSDAAVESVYRSYRIVLQHQPAILITETFPCSVYR